MSSTTESQIKYAGNGVQVLFTFPFTYLQSTDIYVSLYNETERRWDDTTEWTFANATTIQFTTAPPTPTGVVTDNIRIQRRTSVSPLVAQFNPGSAIRASDLNDDFEQLQLAVIDNSSIITNTDVGVTSIIAGEGVSVDQATGNVTITNTDVGVTSIIAGEGISVDQATGNVTITNTQEGGGGIPEAPEDNKVYGRENAEWVVVADGETGPVLSVNGQTGAVTLGVEQLADFAYYPDANTFTFTGPYLGANISSIPEANNWATGEYMIMFNSTANPEAEAALSTLSPDDNLELTLTTVTSFGGLIEQTITTKFKSLSYDYPGGEGNYKRGLMTVEYRMFNFNIDPGSSLVLKSSGIINGTRPITTGQALIYDQVTEKWRPEDIAAELNISALPALP
jgi:hypothetical protein